MTMCPISLQTVMSVTCQPSLVPAVPHGSVAPATCPFNQNDPGVALGEMHATAITTRDCCVRSILILFDTFLMMMPLFSAFLFFFWALFYEGLKNLFSKSCKKSAEEELHFKMETGI